MPHPFTGPFSGPFSGAFPPPGTLGFIPLTGPFGPRARRALREHHRGPRGPHGHGPFGPGFFEFNVGPGGFGPGGFGPGRFWGPPGRRGRARRRGDVRAAILTLLAERPMHGYEMIQEITERSGGTWRPSPGSVYPTLQLLEDEGLVRAAESDGSRKLFELTEEGRAVAEKIAAPPWEHTSDGADETAAGHAGLSTAVAQLMTAVAQAGYAATGEQLERIVGAIDTARREIYRILGESD